MKASYTSLALANVRVPVALYKTTGDPKMPSWALGGPKGGMLRPPEAPEPEAEPEPVEADPLEAFSVSPQAPPEGKEDERPYLVEEGTGAHVHRGEERRGLRTDDGTFIDVTDKLDEIGRAEVLEEMEVIKFVRVERVRRELIQGSYYLTSDGPVAPRLLKILWTAMKRTGRVAVVRWTKNTKQAVGILTPHGSKSWVVLQMAWADLWRDPPERALQFHDAYATEEEVGAAEDLIEAMSGSADDALAGVKDTLREKLWELCLAAEAGTAGDVKVPPPPKRVPAEDANLEEMFSLAAAGTGEAG